MTIVRPLDPAAAERLQDELALLLEDAVAGGASLGFLLPLERAEVLAYWASVVEALRAGRRLLLVALADERVIGAVQLDLETRANGRHRAEVMKLMVLRAHRRQGVGRELMSAMLALARAAGRSLLLLDVRTGDPAEALYRSLEFVKFGEVPRYARSPDGGLAASSFYYLEPTLPLEGAQLGAVMHEKAELVAPSLRHGRSYLAALREGFRRGAQDRVSERRISQIEADFASYIEAITDQTGSIRLLTGEIVPKVPFSVFWLVEGDEFVGEASIRHELNAHLLKEGGHVGYGIRPSRQRQGYGRLILALALAECRRLGLDRVLLTCDDRNLASARIIEANGGRLENVVADPAGRGALRRYWISL